VKTCSFAEPNNGVPVTMRASTIIATVVILLVPTSAMAAQIANDDADTLMACLSAKLPPEGDLPPPGSTRDTLLKAMEGGTTACVGLVERGCEDEKGIAAACLERESRAWIKALEQSYNQTSNRNRAIWKKAVDRIVPQAKTLCEGAAALSAWGRDAVLRQGKYGMSTRHSCVRDAIAQQAIIMLSNVRGN
jgi:hypothetical protein